jgi:hypothetical protein
MTDAELLILFKLQIQILTDALDEYLMQVLNARKGMIRREGIVEDLSSSEYIQILLMQAAYLYNKRDTGEGEPRALRFAKNNLLFSQKIQSEGDD